jgi:plasmid stabilization system protein ParE
VKKRIHASRRVWAQIDRASRWWRENRDKAPEAFDDDFAEALDRIRTNPGRGMPVSARRVGVRSVWLDRIGYYVYYRLVDDEIVEILALWHASRGSRPRL